MAREKPKIRVAGRDFLGKNKRGLDKFTRLAISKFEQVERLKRRCEELTIELHIAVAHVPDKDMGEYIERTQSIIETQWEKLEAFRKKWGNRYEPFL